MDSDAQKPIRHGILITEHIINGKKYFHIGCRENWIYCGYSVVHEWERLDEWIKHFKEFHGCEC